MAKTAIIGAGPIGLYLAFKLHEAGVRDVEIFDPRAGIYTRPGQLSNDVFLYLSVKTKTYINFKAHNKKGNTTGHIKDLERALYDIVSKLQIPIHKKAFVRFNQGSKKKSIVVIDSNNVEEVIECDYLFDSTGSSRKVIHAINMLHAKAPFMLKSIYPIEIKVKQHLIAYVKMSEKDLNHMNLHHFEQIKIPDSSVYVNIIEALRDLGWQEFGVPQCYGHSFGSTKAALYIECPDRLEEKDYKKWIEAAIKARVGNTADLRFELLPDSKKYAKKPRLLTFPVNPQEVVQSSAIFTDYPQVIPVGDALIEPHYFLTHGVLEGAHRAERLAASVIVKDEGIVELDFAKFQDSIAESLSAHRKAITAHFDNREEIYRNALLQAKQHYESESINPNTKISRQSLDKSLAEIDSLLKEGDDDFYIEQPITKSADNTATAPQRLFSNSALDKNAVQTSDLSSLALT